MTNEFSQRITQALNDAELRQNFKGAMHFLRDKRAQSINEVADWESLIQQGAALRRHVLAQLPELLELLEANCQRNGIHVHWAADATEARGIITQIAQSHDVKRVVKGKSMATEEIHLNEHLIAQDIECIESDMGEYIVQLAQETPSHIIMPAIHKNRLQIAQLFEDKLNVSRDPDDVDGLIGIGRQVLRNKFQFADMGISGVNFAAAESGTLCLVENEGNGRMSTTVPPVHVALMGLEKVIPSLNDLPPLLSLLTRSATGQAITTYLNLISGPRKDHEQDGPKEVHLVILDNGRSRIQQDADMQETLACIRCGACMNHCPVYTRIGGHAYGTTYPGPIGQVLVPQLEGLATHAPLVSACSLNGACGEACPVKIDLPMLIRRLRQRAQHSSPHARRFEGVLWQIWRWLNTHPRSYRLITGIARFGRKLPFPTPKAWKQRTFPRPAKTSLHQLMKQRNNKNHEHN